MDPKLIQDARVLRVEVALKPNDVYTPFRWERGNLIRWVACIALCLIFYDLYTNSAAALLSFPDGRSILALVGILAVFILLGLLVFPYLRIRAMFRKSPGMSRTRRYAFSSNGVSVQSDDANSDCKWSLFQRVLETRTAFVLYMRSGGAMYVPKRCLISVGDLTLMREILRQNMSGKSGLRID